MFMMGCTCFTYKYFYYDNLNNIKLLRYLDIHYYTLLQNLNDKIIKNMTITITHNYIYLSKDKWCHDQ